MAGGFDTTGFVLPENNFAGLYKIGDDLETRNKAAALAAKQAATQKLAGEKYVNNTLGDSKALYTGTPYDPLYTKNINDAHSQAEEMFNQGVDYNSVLMAIQPLVSQANNYATAAKDYQLKKKNFIAAIGTTPGIDKTLVSTEMDKQAFPVDPKTGIPDVTKYDPNTDYGDLALRNGDVYNNNSINDFVAKNPGKVVSNQGITVRDPNGGLRQTTADMTTAPFMQPEKDKSGVITGFVPKYDVATDGDQPILHQVGEQAGQPVRMVTDDVFNSLPATALAYIRQETRNLAAKSNVPLNSVQAEHLAKAIAYDELNNSGKNSSSIKETTVQKAPLPDNYYAHRDYASRHPVDGSENTWIAPHLDNLQQTSLSSPVIYKNANGTETKQFNVPLDAPLAKALARNGKEPDRVYFNPTTNQYTPIFFTKYSKGEATDADRDAYGQPAKEGSIKGNNGTEAVDNNLSQPISRNQVELALGSKVVSKKAVSSEMGKAVGNPLVKKVKISW